MQNKNRSITNKIQANRKTRIEPPKSRNNNNTHLNSAQR